MENTKSKCLRQSSKASLQKFAEITDVVNNNLNFSISKKLQRIAKKRKEEEKLDPELEGLFDQLQILREN